MGQGISKLKQKRRAKTLREILPERTPGDQGPVPNFNREALLITLANVASYIKKKNTHITVIPIGGAVNTIYLKSRETTHDIDFFSTRFSRPTPARSCLEALKTR
jgi:hypothetical protein